MKLKVIGQHEVQGHAPGETFERAVVGPLEQAWIESGHVAVVVERAVEEVEHATVDTAKKTEKRA